MRILKRNLAFVLVLVMALSLTVSAANVNDYKDFNDVSYVEAVDVMTALGILQGEDGVFNPQNTLTREQGAKIIAYMMLGKKAADSLTTSVAPFNDVAANRWSAGYIAYCANKDIVGGYGDGNFGPNDQLTGTQFAKMLLRAVGYGVNGEFKNNGWESAVNSTALVNGVFEGNEELALSAACTREEAALYAFNALTNVMTVKYSKDADEYFTGSALAPVTEFNANYTLAKTLYNLTSKNTVDAYGRACRVWKQGNKEITAKFHDAADAVYTKEVKANAIYADLGLSSTTEATVIVDGVEQPKTFQLKKGLTTALAESGNGTVVEAYVNEKDEVTLVVVNTYLAKVKADAKDGEVDVTVYNGIGSKTFKTGVEYKKDEYVLVTYADGAIQSMVAADTVEGKLEAVSGTSYIKVDGTKYSLAKTLKTDDTTVFDKKFNATMSVILDEYGYAIGMVVKKEAETKDEGYVLVTASKFEEGNLLTSKGAVVQVMHLDGTGEEVLPLPTKTVNGKTQVKLPQNDKYVDLKNGLTVTNGFYGYYMDDNGCIVLRGLKPTEFVVENGGTVKMEKDNQKVTIQGLDGKNMDSATELVLVTNEKAETVTGYKNININVTVNTAAEKPVNVLVVYSGSIVKKVYVTNGTTKTEDVFAYYKGEIESGSKGDYVTLYVNGEAVTYLNKAGDLAEGAYKIVTSGSELTTATKVADASAAKTVTAVKNLYFTAGSDEVYYAEGVKIYDVTDGGAEATVATKDKVVYVMDGTLATHVWIIDVDNSGNEVKPDKPETPEIKVTVKEFTVTVSDDLKTATFTVKVENEEAGTKIAVQPMQGTSYIGEAIPLTKSGDSYTKTFTSPLDGKESFTFDLLIDGAVVETSKVIAMVK